jgi:hypothetical protein
MSFCVLINKFKNIFFILIVVATENIVRFCRMFLFINVHPKFLNYNKCFYFIIMNSIFYSALKVKHTKGHSLSRVVIPATLQHHLCQRSFYKIFVKFRNSKKNVLKIVLIIVNINKDENKSLISN